MKDYYEILGVSRAAEGEDIREAYRDRVKRCHPDSSQTSETVPTFLDVQEAYDVLRDTGRRRDYDQHLESRGRRGTRPFAEGYRAGFESYETARPFGFAEGFGRRAGTWKTDLEALDLELSRDEALRGGSHSLPLDDGRLCPMCGGTGAVFVFRCAYCRGSGRLGASSRVIVRIPKGVRTGERIVGYDRHGKPTADIRVVVR